MHRTGSRVRTNEKQYELSLIHIYGDKKRFTVRKMSGTVGVERIFPIESPAIDSIEVNKVEMCIRDRSKRSRVKGSMGRALCESTSVSPCPGKCLHTDNKMCIRDRSKLDGRITVK